MDLTTYHQNIEAIWLKIEQLLEESEADWEIQGNVFTICFENGQQIVINKQEPLYELWLASRAGGFHFQYQNGCWQTQTGESFAEKLNQAFAFCGEDLHFSENE